MLRICFIRLLWPVSCSTEVKHGFFPLYKALECFHVEAAHRLTKMHPHDIKGEWVYPHSANVLATTYLQPTDYCIQRRRHTISQTIKGRKILEKCRGLERR